LKFEKTLKNLFGKEPDAAVQELLKNIEDDYGEVPFILKAMSDKPNVLLPKIIYDDAVLRNPEHLDEKTVELITIGVATALKCDHCLRMHLRVARRKGITQDEIFEAILLASALSNTAALAQAMRVYEEDRDDAPEDDVKADVADCDGCVVVENHNHNSKNGKTE
jgi:AhpD family alkylhydroperoxidase